MEKHELSKIDFDLIDDAFKTLLQSRPDPVTADKVADLRSMFRDAFTGWLKERVIQLTTMAARVVVTAESLLDEAEQVRQEAMKSGQLSAANTAIKGKAVLTGH